MTDLFDPAGVISLRDGFARHCVTHCALLASSFRSGSTFVAALLARNGVPGLELERFNKAWQARAVADYLDTVIGPFAGGMFPSKLMWPHRSNLARLVGCPRDASAQFAAAFPYPAWLFVRRRDAFRQAISFWRAKRSNRWHVYVQAEEPEIAYDFAQIDACARELALHERLWIDFFDRASITPCTVFYEDVLADPGILDGFLAPFGQQIATTEVTLKKQGDDRSQRYLDQYLADLYQRGD